MIRGNVGGQTGQWANISRWQQGTLEEIRVSGVSVVWEVHEFGGIVSVEPNWTKPWGIMFFHDFSHVVFITLGVAAVLSCWVVCASL